MSYTPEAEKNNIYSLPQLFLFSTPKKTPVQFKEGEAVTQGVLEVTGFGYVGPKQEGW